MYPAFECGWKMPLAPMVSVALALPSSRRAEQRDDSTEWSRPGMPTDFAIFVAGSLRTWV
jgi:hypothetical protein